MSLDSRANEDALPMPLLDEEYWKEKVAAEASGNYDAGYHERNRLRCRERQLRQSIADTRTLRQALELIEHKADQRLQGQYTEALMLGIILKTARTALLTPEARAALKETEHA